MSGHNTMFPAKATGLEPSEKVKAACPEPFVCFALGTDLFALALASVKRVVRMAHITPVPDPPPHIAGVIDIQGRVVPVMRLAGRFGYPAKPVGINDRLLVIQALGREMALIVDDVIAIVQVPAEGREPPVEPRNASHPVVTMLRTEMGLVMELDAKSLVPAQ